MNGMRRATARLGMACGRSLIATSPASTAERSAAISRMSAAWTCLCCRQVSLSLCLSVSLSLSVSSVSRCAWLPVCLSARHSDSDSDSDECRVNLPLLQDARQFILFTVVHINMKSSSKAACCSSRPRDEQRTAKANVPPPYTVLISVLCVWRYVFLWSR